MLVNDSHGGFRNLLPDQLDPRARVVLGKPRYLGMMAGVEAGADGVLMIGYHGRAQSRGVLAHTINSGAFARVWLNGKELGEAGLYAALAGEFGAPVLMASGDDVFVQETHALMPWVRYVETKSAGGFGSGTSLSPRRRARPLPQRRQSRARTRAGAMPAHRRTGDLHPADPGARARRPLLPVADAGAPRRRDAVVPGRLGPGRGAHAELPVGDVVHAEVGQGRLAGAIAQIGDNGGSSNTGTTRIA